MKSSKASSLLTVVGNDILMTCVVLVEQEEELYIYIRVQRIVGIVLGRYCGRVAIKFEERTLVR